MSILKSTSGQGAELRDLLTEALNIPPNFKWFDVRFAAGEPVTVRCEFMPEEQAEAEDDDAPNAPASLDG